MKLRIDAGQFILEPDTSDEQERLAALAEAGAGVSVTAEDYGFTYEFGGRRFSFTVTASSEAEALARVQAMSSAALGGVVREDVSGREEGREPALSSQASPGGKRGSHESDSATPQGSSRTLGERLDLIHQMFERCSQLQLRVPSPSDMDDFLDGRTSVMPPEDNALNRVLNVRRAGTPKELLYDLLGPNGEQWKIYLNGEFEGFPPGTSGTNYALPLVNAMIGEVKKLGASFSMR